MEKVLDARKGNSRKIRRAERTVERMETKNPEKRAQPNQDVDVHDCDD